MHIGDDYRHDHSQGSPKGQSQIGIVSPWKIVGVVLLGLVAALAVVQGGRVFLNYLDSTVNIEGQK